MLPHHIQQPCTVHVFLPVVSPSILLLFSLWQWSSCLSYSLALVLLRKDGKVQFCHRNWGEDQHWVQQGQDCHTSTPMQDSVNNSRITQNLGGSTTLLRFPVGKTGIYTWNHPGCHLCVYRRFYRPHRLSCPQIEPERSSCPINFYCCWVQLWLLRMSVLSRTSVLSVSAMALMQCKL